jgi:hypothetical protein
LHFVTREKENHAAGASLRLKDEVGSLAVLCFSSLFGTLDEVIVRRGGGSGAVRNLDGWYKAFDVKPTDKLYLSPAERVRIW